MSIVDEIKVVIKTKPFQNQEALRKFAASSKWFDEMVVRGVAIPRQNQIMPLDEQYRRKILFNTANHD